MNTSEKLRVQKILSVLTLTIGLVLMTMMITTEGEPGAIPLLLVVLGAAGYLVTRARARSLAEPPR